MRGPRPPRSCLLPLVVAFAAGLITPSGVTAGQPADVADLIVVAMRES